MEEINNIILNTVNNTNFEKLELITNNNNNNNNENELKNISRNNNNCYGNNNNNNNNNKIYFFAYLLINPDVSEKIKTEIFYSVDPFKELKVINERKIAKIKAKYDYNNDDDNYFENDKQENNDFLNDNQKQEIDEWYLHMIIGPFEKNTEANLFQKKWKNGTRGIESRIHQGIKLAAFSNLNIWVNSNNKDELEKVKEEYYSYKK
jgi:hypothetical protein